VNRFFHPNLSHRGRLARGVVGALCLIAGIIVAGDYTLWGLIFESIRGWCLLRACGIKTKF
jgi:hypothetical protein